MVSQSLDEIDPLASTMEACLDSCPHYYTVHPTFSVHTDDPHLRSRTHLGTAGGEGWIALGMASPSNSDMCAGGKNSVSGDHHRVAVFGVCLNDIPYIARESYPRVEWQVGFFPEDESATFQTGKRWSSSGHPIGAAVGVQIGSLAQS
jgi:hypothetical protein